MFYHDDTLAVNILIPLVLLLSSYCINSPYEVDPWPVRWAFVLYFTALASQQSISTFRLSINENESSLVVLSLAAVGLVLFGLVCATLIIPWTRQQHRDSAKPDTGDGPWLLPCVTSHSRQFPKRHSFSYSYLQLAFKVGVPTLHGRLLGIETGGETEPWTWFSILSRDYLFRGRELSLRQKLDQYLRSEGVDPSKTPNVYLVTAPRFLGYSFNPVSFWYLYDEQMVLRYMILEVNNTFDERRPYLLERARSESSEDDLAASDLFQQRWPKDFHVSPFNSRKGSYSLAAKEPSWCVQTRPQISNIITLRSSKNHPKLVARLESTEPGRRIDHLSFFEATRFILSWFWVSFVTFPRILKEAAKLFFVRKLHVWYRPEVLRKSIGRQATERENAIAAAFDRFLKHKSSQLAIPVAYSKSWECPEPVVSSFTQTQDHGVHNKVQVHVHSPEFFAQYARNQCIIKDAASLSLEARTFSIVGEAEDITSLLIDCSNPSQTKARRTPMALGTLRWLQSKFSRPRSHPMDIYVFDTYGNHESDVCEFDSLQHKYGLAVQGLLLSEFLTMGIPEILDIIYWVNKVILLWMSLNVTASHSLSLQTAPSFLWVAGSLSVFLQTSFSVASKQKQQQETRGVKPAGKHEIFEQTDDVSIGKELVK